MKTPFRYQATGDDSNHLEWLQNKGNQEANLSISSERLDSDSRENYSMGPTKVRECCLLDRL